MNAGAVDGGEGTTLFESIILLLTVIYRECYKLCLGACLLVHELCESYGNIELVNVAILQLSHHPILGFGLLCCGLACVLPIVLYILFVITSIIVGVAAFLIVESTFLALATFAFIPLLFGYVLSMCLLAFGFTLSYFTCYKFGKLIQTRQ